ncbi:unnamed protein product [Clonostachys rosea f. rosea IK726]|uniref:Uncharacterized protein n=2 Tax=Bionectria ochroleuca TaxID=29856 RepID=A0A8H7NFY5_BIOOC|nr:unnamed protein product [Clonostachys rosea f. rosea IK726]
MDPDEVVGVVHRTLPHIKIHTTKDLVPIRHLAARQDTIIKILLARPRTQGRHQEVIAGIEAGPGVVPLIKGGTIEDLIIRMGTSVPAIIHNLREATIRKRNPTKMMQSTWKTNLRTAIPR